MSCMGTAMDVTCSYDGADTNNGVADAASGASSAALIVLSSLSEMLKLIICGTFSYL